MNKIIQQLQNHSSVRDFQDKPLSASIIEQLVKSAQSASTSHFVQAYSIIGVTDLNKRKQLAEIAGNSSYVFQTGQLFVFIADLARVEHLNEKLNKSSESLSTTEKMFVAIIDASLAAQNMAIAAESMDLGICFIGGLRNNISETAKILELPTHTIPLFGLTVGYPNQPSKPKPRLPEMAVYHENTYQFKDEALAIYDKEIETYYTNRTNGTRTETWSQQVTSFFEHPDRLDLKAFLEKQGFDKK